MILFPSVPGIYECRHINSGKFYLGSSINMLKRQSEHYRSLLYGIHHSYHLQRAWDKYGENDFAWEVIKEITDIETLRAEEQFYLDLFQPWKRQFGYNISPLAIGGLLEQSEEAKIQISYSSILTTLRSNPYSGVRLDRRHQTYNVNIRIDRNSVYVGSYKDRDDGRIARNIAYRDHYSNTDPKFWELLQPLLGDIHGQQITKLPDRGKHKRSSESRRKLSESKKGKSGHSHSASTRERISLSNKLAKNTPEAKGQRTEQVKIKLIEGLKAKANFLISHRIYGSREVYEVATQLGGRENRIHIGSYGTVEDARLARNVWLMNYWSKEDRVFWLEQLAPIIGYINDREVHKLTNKGEENGKKIFLSKFQNNRYAGIFLDKTRYFARLTLGGRPRFLRSFSTKEEARLPRNEMIKEYWSKEDPAFWTLLKPLL